MASFHNVELKEDDTGFRYQDAKGGDASALTWLFIIKQAWDRGVNFDDLLGYDSNGDWSCVRDEENPEVNNAMLERALNFFFGEKKR
jgi:hypothetical protein